MWDVFIFYDKTQIRIINHQNWFIFQKADILVKDAPMMNIGPQLYICRTSLATGNSALEVSGEWMSSIAWWSIAEPQAVCCPWGCWLGETTQKWRNKLFAYLTFLIYLISDKVCILLISLLYLSIRKWWKGGLLPYYSLQTPAKFQDNKQRCTELICC